MKVKVEIVGALLKTRGQRQLECELSEGSTLRELLIELCYEPLHQRHILGAVQGEVVRHDTPLREGATVVLSTLVGGG
ncbi:MAG: MoaD/ThiS family protein [Deltaproteobacteria bacterium]|nr:MoaD/ThiS family protein [Deltaproteobacteria bacterium]